MNTEPKPLVSMNEIQQITGVRWSTIRQWIATGKRPTIPVSDKRVKVPRKALEQFLATGQVVIPNETNA